MKLLVIGANCAGKTTVIKYLRAHTDDAMSTIMEMDEEIARLNGGEWPKDLAYKNEVLVPQILKRVADMSEVIFFESHLTPDQVAALKQDGGFTTVLIEVDQEELQRRNRQRVAEEGYADASTWINSQLISIAEMKNRRLFHTIIDGSQPTEMVAGKITKLDSNSSL
ncbi:MAG TPA: AAA family ATPase [Candidatus Paceibacterota bacterium]